MAEYVADFGNVEKVHKIPERDFHKREVKKNILFLCQDHLHNVVCNLG